MMASTGELVRQLNSARGLIHMPTSNTNAGSTELNGWRLPLSDGRTRPEGPFDQVKGAAGVGMDVCFVRTWARS